MNLKYLLCQGKTVKITAAIVGTLVILFRATGVLQAWEWGAYDFYLRHRIESFHKHDVVIVGIDEADLRNIGQAIIPDIIYAQLLEKLQTRQPRAIGLNIYRDLPVPPGNRELIEQFATIPNLIGIQKVVGDKRRDTVPPPPTLAQKGQVGASDMVIDSDNRVRRGLLYLSNEQGDTIYSFALYLALIFLEAENIKPQQLEGAEIWQLGEQVFTPLHSSAGGYVSADTKGYQLLLNYHQGNNHFETVSLTDVLQDKIAPDWGHDKVILIGAVGESWNDLYFTPHSGGWFLPPQPMAGVEIEAHLISQIIDAAQGESTLVRTWSELVEWLWILSWSGVGAIIAWRWSCVQTRLICVQQFARLAIATGILVASTYGALCLNWWIPFVPALIALKGSATAIVAVLAHKAVAMRRLFGRYLSPEIVTELLEGKASLQLGGRRQQITVLVADLRGFTASAEKLLPETAVQILNVYLQHMSQVIKQYGGVINKFLGDGILAIFGIPLAKEDDATRAVACAIAMQQEMEAVNQKLETLCFPPLQTGIAINTGEALVGNVGSQERTEYTAIGAQVNLAFRIETYTTGKQILISQATKAAVGNAHLRIDEQKQVLPKGVQQLITLYEVGGIGEPYNLSLPFQKEKLILLTQPIPIAYSILAGEQVSTTSFRGNIIKLSDHEAQVRVHTTRIEQMPLPLSDIKLNLLLGEDLQQLSESVYAKVLEKSLSSDSFFIHFTFIPPAVVSMLRL